MIKQVWHAVEALCWLKRIYDGIGWTVLNETPKFVTMGQNRCSFYTARYGVAAIAHFI